MPDCTALALRKTFEACGPAPWDDFAQNLIREAYTWRGTPFEKNGKIKQVGVDCGHFIDEVFSAVGVDTCELPAHYLRGPHLLQMLLRKSVLVYVPTQWRSPGDIIAFCDEACSKRKEPAHLAFITERTPMTTFIIEAGVKGVVRHRLDGWWMRRIHSVWRYPR